MDGLLELYLAAKKNGYFTSMANEDELIAEVFLQIGAVPVLGGLSKLEFAKEAAGSALCFFRQGGL